MPDLEYLRARNRTDARPSPPAARRHPAAFKGLASPRPRPKPCWKECSRISTACARSGTGSRKNSRPQGGCSAVGAGMSEPIKWYDDNADNGPWIKALAEVRRLAPREGWCYHHVQAIIVSIDQYAESALDSETGHGSFSAIDARPPSAPTPATFPESPRAIWQLLAPGEGRQSFCQQSAHTSSFGGY
jgi:hypothetical protein